MLKTLDFQDIRDGYRARMPRGELNVEEATQLVRPVVAAVQHRGLEALREYSQRFDGVIPDSFRVAKADLDRNLAELDPKLKRAFEIAIERRRKVALAEGWADQGAVTLAEGAQVLVRTIPTRRVGLYVPGGLAPLASSVLMNVVPAQVAQVGSIAVASPPQKEFGGLPHPTVLAMCALLGIDEVYAVGGAQAIAMFSYGVADLCEPVDLVTGPGNIYVVAAKRLLRGVVGVDSEAGPTEIAVLADAGANPAYVAADLISQAEHDPMAASVLVTDSPELIAAVNAEIATQVATTKHVERIKTALAGQQSAAILVRDLEQGLEVVDAYAAEHLEIQTADAARVAARVRNAGAIFVGPYSPVPLGDYTAGSTHVLPTLGTATFASGLTVRSFMRTVHVVEYSQAALLDVAEVVENFGLAEDLPAHAFAATVRRQK